MPYLVFGFVGSAVGIIIYFFLPYSILTLNLGLLLDIFFGLLLSMIVGLTLIAFNLQRSIELVIVKILLFFETKSMKILVLKNLGAHRESNRLTSLIYSLTLGSIIFVLMAAKFEIGLINDPTEHGLIDLKAYVSYGEVYASQIDPVIKKYEDYFENWGYISTRIEFLPTV